MKDNAQKIILIIIILLIFSFNMFSAKDGQNGERVKYPFFVYSDYGAADKLHYYASGKIGDVYTLSLVGNWRENPFSGKSCIKIVYDPSDRERRKLSWAGVYWLNPAMNFGLADNAGYDLRGARKLVFYARGENGGEKLLFCMGGVGGKFPDSDKSDDFCVTLTKKWERYEILLSDLDLSYIVGGFYVGLNYMENWNRTVFYLDEIYYIDKER